MSSVHVGRMLGPAGFGRTVAIKRLHSHYATDPDFVSMMIDEARLVSRIHHPNVVSTLDVMHTSSDLFLVMEYVSGETLTKLRALVAEQGLTIPRSIALAIMTNVLLGLDAAHEATGEDGRRLNIIHRDISPQNILVGVDGQARILDFGIARAAGASHHSDGGILKGKIAYMSPEQLRLDPGLGRATDIYAANVVLWEMLTGRRLFEGTSKEQLAFLVLSGAVRSPRVVDPSISEELDDIVMRGLESSPEKRFPSARAMAEALEPCGRIATPREVADWVATVASAPLAERAAMISRIERDTASRIDVRALATKLAAGRIVDDMPPVTAGDAIEATELYAMDSVIAASERIDPVVAVAETPSNGGRRRSLALAGVIALLALTLGVAFSWRVAGPDGRLERKDLASGSGASMAMTAANEPSAATTPSASVPASPTSSVPQGPRETALPSPSASAASRPVETSGVSRPVRLPSAPRPATTSSAPVPRGLFDRN